MVFNVTIYSQHVLETRPLRKVSVAPDPSSVGRDAPRSASGRVNAIRAGDSNGPTLPLVHSTCAVANLAFVARLPTFVQDEQFHRQNAAPAKAQIREPLAILRAGTEIVLAAVCLPEYVCC